LGVKHNASGRDGTVVCSALEAVEHFLLPFGRGGRGEGENHREDRQHGSTFAIAIHCSESKLKWIASVAGEEPNNCADCRDSTPGWPECPLVVLVTAPVKPGFASLILAAHPFRKERGKSGAPGFVCDFEVRL
jgi:hypothetical protein